jgi:integrase
MSDPRNQVVRVGPGIYRRGHQYVVRYRDPTGRQRKQTVGSLREAEAIRSAAQISRRQRPKDEQMLRLLLMHSGTRPNELAAVRWSDIRRRDAAPETPAPHNPRRPWPASDWRQARSSERRSPEA